MNSAMEQTRYWMWTRRKFGGSRPLPLFNPPISNIVPSSSYHESLEEQVFAEDSAGLLGGCIWPPRSYTCSFCRREFRSAQALGGHMNVHRRDRARLKQSSSPTNEGSELHPPDQVTPLDYYSPSPNPNPNPSSMVIGSFTNPIPVRVPNALELKLELGNWKVREVGGKGKRDWEEDVEIVCSTNKRMRTDEVPPSIVKPSFGDRLQIIGRSEVLKLSPSPVEELDLELRLGDPPKVK